MALVVLAITLSFELAQLDDKDATVHRVDDDPAAREGVVTPGAELPERFASALLVVVTRVDIEVGDLLNRLASRVSWDCAYVKNA
jgi:hypothetical protein